MTTPAEYPDNPERNGLRFDWTTREDAQGVYSYVFALDAQGEEANTVATFRATANDDYDETCGRLAEADCAKRNADA